MNYENSHRKNVDLYARQIDQIYQSAVSEATAIGQSVANLNGDKLFSFADYPITHDRIDKLINKLKNSVETIILNGIDSEWTLSNNKNNELCNRVFGDNVGKLSKEQYRRYYSTNGKAQDAFKARKVAGLGLSDRVWSYTKQFKTEIELGLDLGIGSGLPATEITRDLKEYLKYPDKLFRRVRDKHGALQLSKAAKAFNPGQGVYRSSYKNALRLTLTETNIAYRTADHERWQQFDFVVGIEIKKSANHPIADMCDNLAGKYPKDFKFTGWHPQCRCYAVSILKTSDEMERDTQRILSGEPIDGKSVNSVNDTPLNFKDWIEDNQERIDKAKQLPYFLRDNRSFWEEKNNAKSVRRVKTDADRVAIQEAWNDRKVMQAPKFGNKDEFEKIKTLKDIENYVTKYNIADTVNFKGFTKNDIGIAKQMITSFEYHYNLFPELRDKISFVGSIQGRCDLLYNYHYDSILTQLRTAHPQIAQANFKLLETEAKKRAIARVKPSKANTNTMAYSAPNQTAGLNGIAWNKKFVGEGLVKTLDSDVNSKFHPIGGNSPKFIADHELGHKIDELLDLRSTKEFKDLLAKHKFLQDKEYVKNNLSGYALAKSDGAEFIAEAWGEYLNNPNPRLIASELGDLINRIYKIKFKGTHKL